MPTCMLIVHGEPVPLKFGVQGCCMVGFWGRPMRGCRGTDTIQFFNFLFVLFLVFLFGFVRNLRNWRRSLCAS